jgi:hypothetical protein
MNGANKLTVHVSVHHSTPLASSAGGNSYVPPTNCLTVAAPANVTGTNSESINAQVWENCWNDVTSGFVQITATEVCSYTGRGSQTVLGLPSPWAKGSYWFQPVTATAVCEVCKNGAPVLFPSFTVNNDVYAQGQAAYNGRNYTVTGDATSSVNLANSPNYTIPCP